MNRVYKYNSSDCEALMFFPEDDHSQKKVQPQKIVYLYDTGTINLKATEIVITHKTLSFHDVKKVLNTTNLRLFNSEGAEYFEDDIKYIKNKTVLYATRGEDFDSSSCFSEYQMSQKLGEGGFGNVYLAKHKQTAEMFAIKVIKTQNIGSVSDIDAIFVEAEILKSLRHQNIVKVFNCLTLKNMEVAIIMEFLQGGELLKYVEKEEKLDEKTALTFFRQIVKGMLYCHQNNLIHRDLKLQNILLVNSEEKKIKIIDFGIAGAITNFTQQDLDIGSLSYMAPQCFTNSKDYKVDGRIDVWATGVILFCMLHGYLPFKGASNHQTIEIIKSGKYRIDPNLQKNVSELCIDALKRCLEVNPKKRATMEELADHPWVNKNLYVEQTQIKLAPSMEAIKQQLIVEPKAKLKKNEKIPTYSPLLKNKISKK